MKQRKNSIVSKLQRKRALPLLLFALGFAVIGTILLFASRAATPYVSLEPEQGTKSSSVTTVTDTTASGGQAVKFGTGTTGPSPTFPTTQTVTQTSQFNGGINTSNGSLTNISSPTDSKITMRGVLSAGGASYARGIISKNPDGTKLSLGEGKEIAVDVSVIFKDTGNYVSVARFDNYDPYTSNGSIFGIERWSNNTLHIVSSRYDASTPLLNLTVPNMTIQANVRYDFRLEAKLSSGTGGYTHFYINGTKVLDSTAANNQQERVFTKLRSGVVAVGTNPVNVDFGNVALSY